MSTDFGDSCNLVVDVTSPTNLEKDDNFEALTDDTKLSSEAASDFREKSPSKGFGFMKKRSKSPFRSPLKPHLKSPFKHSKSSSKTQLKSPTRDIPKEEIEKVEKSISEKKSEEWQMFQQMQDRIKLNVVKTQTTLDKLSLGDSGSEDSSKKQRKVDDTLWSSDDDTSSLIPKGQGHKSLKDNPVIDETMQKPESTSSNADFDLLGLGEDYTHLVPPSRPPRPPANSLRSSMENLLYDNVETTNTPQQEGDLLGLNSDANNSGYDQSDTMPTSTCIINEDLLGLDNLMSPNDSQYGSSLHSSFDGSDMMYGPMSHSERSSQMSTPLGFDNWEDNPNIQVGTLSSTFVSSMVDEFLQLDTMKDVKSADLNPYDASQQSEIKKSSTLDELDPFSSKPPPSAPSAQNTTSSFVPHTDPYTTESQVPNLMGEIHDNAPCSMDGGAKIDMFNSERDLMESNTDTAKPVEEYDNFGFGTQASVDIGLDMTAEPTNDQGDVTDTGAGKDITSNPFLASEGNNHPGSTFDENFFESRITSNDTAASVSDAWGIGDTAVADNSNLSCNPFQDAFFPPEPIDVLDQGASAFFGKDMTGLEEAETDAVVNNPFLQADIGNFAPTQTNVNPFLTPDTEAPVGSDLQSDVDNFLFGAASAAPSTDEKKPSTMDDFDPFGMSASEPVVETSDDKIVEHDSFSAAVASQDDQLVDPDDFDDDNTFKLEIKPVKPSSLNTTGASSILPPAIKPPPRPPRSPQPPRVNPFNKDPTPEDDFDIGHPHEVESEGTKSIKSSCDLPSFSTDEYTPEEELAKLPPLSPFHYKTERDGWELMLRHPTKKKLTTNRSWKHIYVRLSQKTEETGPIIKLYFNKTDNEPFQELPIQPCYSISDVSLQHYDQYGKIYTIKIQYIFYKERVGIRPDRITSSFVKKPKATMILDHAPQISEMMKFGSLDKEEVSNFVRAIEDTLMNIEAHREKTLTYVKDEVSAEVWDEYKALLNKEGKMLTQKARVRVFFLAFVTGMPAIELGLNDKRRQGKEVVGRHDIIPIKTEEWIRLEDVEFHCSVDLTEFEKSNNIRFRPLDACQFELLRYRVRLRENKELPLQLKIQQILKESRFEIRCDLLVTGYHSFSKKHGQFPCEDIEVRFPVPEPWIYLFRYERRFGYGSFKSAIRKPGKIKGLERLTMIAQGLLTPTLMEADVGVAKYEHICKCVVWRIPRLPERNEGV